MKRVVFLLLLSLFFLHPLVAYGEGQYYSLSTSLFPYHGFAHFPDEVPMRTSAGLEVSIGVIGFTFKPIDVSLELLYRGVTASIPHGFYRARGFNSVGLALRFSRPLGERISIWGQGGSEINFYRRIDEAFASFSIAAGPEFLIAQNPTFRLTATSGLTLHLRKEITAVSISAGMRYQLYPTRSSMR
jgi:hypothetical protein